MEPCKAGITRECGYLRIGAEKKRVHAGLGVPISINFEDSAGSRTNCKQAERHPQGALGELVPAPLEKLASGSGKADCSRQGGRGTDWSN